MNDVGIEIIALVSIIIAFIAEGLSHGFRWKESYPKFRSQNNDKLNKYWHRLNIVFIGFLFIGTYLFTLGSNYNWEYKFDKFFFYDISWIALRIVLIRYCLFNYFNNLGKGANMLYYGTTSTLDILYTKYISRWFPPSFVFILKSGIIIFLLLNIIV